MRLTHKQAIEAGILEANQKKRGRKPDPKTQDRKEGRDRLFDAMCEANGLPLPVSEYRFHPSRLWRFDYLFEGWLAVEVLGGVWARGHHSRGQDQIDDMEKWNEAAIRGYHLLFFTPQQVQDGSAFVVIKRALDHDDGDPVPQGIVTPQDERAED